MTKYVASVRLAHGDAVYAPGEPIELPDETDRDKAEIARLIAQGLVDEAEPKAESKARRQK